YTNKELELKIRTKADQIGKINEIVGKKVAIEKKKIKVEIKSRTKNYERLTEGKELDLDIKIKNITLDDLKNYKFKIEIPENLEIVNFNRKDLKKVSNLEYELNINELKATKNEIFNLKVRTKNFDNKYSNSPYYVNVSMLSNDKKSVEKAKLTGFIVKPKVHIEQSTSKATTYIQEDEIIDYIYKIKNTGSAQSNDLKLRLNLPENATVESFKKITKDETTERDITETVTSPEDIVINPGEEQQYIYKVKIPKNEGLDKKTIQINADIVDKKNNIVTSTAKITQIVEKGAETRSLEQKVLNGELTLSKDEIRKIGIRDTEKQEQKLVRNFEISGKAWKDENKNGVFDKDETILPNIVVKLIDNKKNKIIKTTTTNQDGLYTFKEVANGEYSVMFEFEENKYKPTVFKKNDVEEEKTSKALQTVVKNKGTEKSVAISDAIKIDFASKSNEDLGLRTVDGYDLALKGKITKVSVNNKNSKVIYDKKGKVEPITNVNLNNEDKLTVEYELEVKNEGNIPAFATKIAAYLPENMTFNKADNYNWEEKNGVIYTTELENTKINPQETKIVKIKLERKPEKQKSKQLLNASFEILESKQEQGKNEVDSTPGNKAISEDDMVTLNLIVKKNFKGIIAILLSIIPAVIATVFITKRYIKENKEGGK
ncbi:MAG: SdrD B-like domain-containing protein, partial [Clostridium sp.]